MSAAPLTPRSPLLNLVSLRAIASIPGAELPPDTLQAMRTALENQGNPQLVRELEWLFDLTTGRARTL